MKQYLFILVVIFLGCNSSNDLYVSEVVQRGNALAAFYVSPLHDGEKQNGLAEEYTFFITSLIFTVDCENNKSWEPPIQQIYLSSPDNIFRSVSAELIDYNERRFTYRAGPIAGAKFGPKGINIDLIGHIESDSSGFKVKIIEAIGRNSENKKESRKVVAQKQ